MCQVLEDQDLSVTILSYLSTNLNSAEVLVVSDAFRAAKCGYLTSMIKIPLKSNSGTQGGGIFIREGLHQLHSPFVYECNQGGIFFWHQHGFEHEDKCGRILAFFSRDMHATLIITDILTPAGI